MVEPDEDAPEHERCRWWRSVKMELSREQLGPLVGFSAASIKDFERPGKDIDPMARKRYRLACAAVEMGIEFDWITTELRLNRPVVITMRPETKR